MQTEIEAKFLDADHEVLREKLRKLGATCEQPMRLMKRVNFDFPNRRLNAVNGWARVRDEGDKVTLAYKQLNDRSVEGTKEVQVTVDSFENAIKFLQAIGLRQETKRESWTLDGAQIELDEWPWAKSFMEIEVADERTLRAVAAKLGFDWQHAVHGSVEIVYIGEYQVTEQEVDDWPEITFTPVPDWLEAKRKKVAA